MDDDYNINNNDDDSLSQDLPSAIDGQIGMEELFVREEENPEESPQFIPPIENQISLEDLPLSSLIGADLKGKNNEEMNEVNNQEDNPEISKLANLGQNSGLENDYYENKLHSTDIIPHLNDNKLEEGLNILEDNNNNNNFNFEQENNQNNNYNNYNDNSQNSNEASSFDAQNYNNNAEYNQNDSSNYESDNNNFNQNGESFFEETNSETFNSQGENNQENLQNEESDAVDEFFRTQNEIDNETQNNASDNSRNYENNNSNIDETYGGNASYEDSQFSVESNENFSDNSNNEEDNFSTNNNENASDISSDNYSDDNNDNNNNDDYNNSNNEDNNNNSDDDNNNNSNGDGISQEINEENLIVEENLVSEENLEDTETYEENNDAETYEANNIETYEETTIENPAETTKNNVSHPVKVKAPKSVAKQSLPEENSQVIDDVDNLNKNYEDVEVTVGKDAFADYESGTLETGSIEENEVSVKEKVYNGNDGEDIVDGMLYKNLDTVLHESMIPYSEHVILDRALPRVEDGLKPVQRRILYSMLELGVTPDKPYRKSARIVGDCLGKYHPHGDTSVYDAMVRMAQPFNTNMLLVSGHGNFGSVDGDGAAAMRYTEARLAPLSMELLRDLDKNTVKWGLNFDDTLKEPEILPGRFPNLLVNGATGIAVGLATNIPPHNLAEAIDGVVAYLNNPSISLKEMLKIIKGPDFPTGGYILNNSELFQAYQTGRGKIYMRAKMHIESNGTDKRYIVITELPYQVNKSSLLQKIANFKDEDKFGFGGISEVRDESDREGLRAVIRLKKDADIKAIYKSLLKNTELQTTFGINMVAIANGKPKQMGLLDIISYYAEYQREIIYRRSKYELEQAKEREHILSGLVIAIKNIDAVVKIIKTSQNTTEAKKRLKEKFSLSDRQAQAILDMRLAKLTSLEVYKLEEELKRLRELIKKLTAIIASKKLQKDIVKEEMLQIKRQYKQDRKTKFAKAEEEIASAPEPKEEANQKVVILKSAQGNFKCVSTKQYNYAQKEVNDNSSLFDTHTLKFETETNNTLLAFSSLGNCFKVDVKDFTLSRYRDKGVPEKSIFKELTEKETIVALFDNNITTKQGNLIFLTKYGMIKKTAYTEYALLKKYYQGMKLRDDDEILSIYIEPKDYTVVFVTKQGMVLNATNDDIPLQGRISGGVKGINLASNDYCVGASLATDGGEILAVTNKGYAKRVLVANVDKSARYRKGLKFITFTSENGKEIVFSNVVTVPYTLGCIDNEGELHYRSTDHIPIENRLGKGKAVDRMKKSLTIVRAFKIDN